MLYCRMLLGKYGIKDNYYFEVNTKYNRVRVKICDFKMLKFSPLEMIYLVFTEKIKLSSLFYIELLKGIIENTT